MNIEGSFSCLCNSTGFTGDGINFCEGQFRQSGDESSTPRLNFKVTSYSLPAIYFAKSVCCIGWPIMVLCKIDVVSSPLAKVEGGIFVMFTVRNHQKRSLFEDQNLLEGGSKSFFLPSCQALLDT